MGRAAQRGYTYLALLFVVALSSIALSGAAALWSTEGRRAREQELLFVGEQFRAAIGSYYENSPGAVKQYPASLNELLDDRRTAPPQRHLRRLYADPMIDPITGAAPWALLRSPSGGIVGVHSRSAAAPLKRARFDQRDESFTGKTHYSDWKFVYDKASFKHVPALFQRVP
jgi:type II secretory pathway pseudopilin PulG